MYFNGRLLRAFYWSCVCSDQVYVDPDTQHNKNKSQLTAETFFSSGIRTRKQDHPVNTNLKGGWGNTEFRFSFLSHDLVDGISSSKHMQKRTPSKPSNTLSIRQTRAFWGRIPRDARKTYDSKGCEETNSPSNRGSQAFPPQRRRHLPAHCTCDELDFTKWFLNIKTYVFL